MTGRYRVYCIDEGINKYRNDPSGTCPTNALHTVEPDSIAEVDTWTIAGAVFGDGSDGDVTITTNVALTRDMYYQNLTVSGASGLLRPSGYRIFVADTLTIDNGGTVSVKGNNIATNASGLGGAAPYVAAVLGTGTNGPNATTTNPGANGGALPSGTRLGGTGGRGQNNTGYTPGQGGTGTVPAENVGGLGVFKTLHQAILGRDLSGVQMNGGTGGGGGSAPPVIGGGAAGGGAGVMVLAARNIVSSIGVGTITAAGGNATAVSYTNGGGGGGGVIVLITTTSPIPSTITVTVAGGTTVSSAGIAGSPSLPGQAGTLFLITL